MWDSMLGDCRRSWMSRSLSLLALSATVVVLSSSSAAGQAGRAASLGGTIADEVGAPLPGVTVTLTSPALQVAQIVRVSGSDGGYQFLELPPGTYRLTYELPGFGTLAREGIRLTTGFVARVDAVLTLAAIEETVTVSGMSPLVDVTSTRGGGTVTQEVLESIPGARNMQDTLLTVPGVLFSGPPQVGEIGFRMVSGGYRSYGQGGQTRTVIEGIEMINCEAPDFASIQEVDVRTFGNSADAGAAGGVIQLVVKSGSNEFHGRYAAQGIHRSLQSANIDDTLRAQGISEGDAMRYYYDLSGDLGGRIVRDRLWFYGALREIHNERTATGYAHDPGPDGIYGTIDDTPGLLPGVNRNRTLKLDYQASMNHKLVGFVQRNPMQEPQARADRFIPFESTLRLLHYPKQHKFEWQGVLSDRLLVNAMFGDGEHTAQYWNQDISLTSPSRLNRETGFYTGASFDSRSEIARSPRRRQLSGGLTFTPTRNVYGSHEIRAGYSMWWASQRVTAGNREAGNYLMVFDRVGGVPNQPVELHVRNYPTDGYARNDTLAMYLTDTWRATRRLTFNLGLRMERGVSFVPAQEKVQGPFGGAGNFEKVDVGTWTDLAPRVGVAFDVSGDGKTVLKATYGHYIHDWGPAFAQAYNKNTTVDIRYRWNDPDGNRDYTPGEVNLDLNGPDFLGISGATNNLINPDLVRPHTREFTAAIERELAGGVAVRGLYVYKRVMDQDANINALRPYDAWNLAFPRRDPGPDGILGTGDDGGTVVVYDFDPAFRGADFVGNMRVNAGRGDSFKNYEVSLNKRSAGRWFAFTSLVATKFHEWLTLVPQSPNDEYFPLNETWELNYRLAAGYRLPWGIMASTLYQAYSGSPGQRTNLFRAVDPDGGPRFPSSGSINLRMEPFGAQKGPIRHIVNLRAAKDFRLANGRRFTVDLDALNAFNSNVAWGGAAGGSGLGTNYASGPSFGYVTRIVAPRALRLNVAFEF